MPTNIQSHRTNSVVVEAFLSRAKSGRHLRTKIAARLNAKNATFPHSIGLPVEAKIYAKKYVAQLLSSNPDNRAAAARWPIEVNVKNRRQIESPRIRAKIRYKRASNFESLIQSDRN